MEINNHPNYLIFRNGSILNKKKRRFLKPCLNDQGYLYVCFYNNKKAKNRKIHRLVGDHFIPNPENLPTIDHIDRNPLNNHISNLRWASYKTQANNRCMRSNNTSGYIGLSWLTREQRWRVRIKTKPGKYFKSKEDAIQYLQS
jgi:hypothetical protein